MTLPSSAAVERLFSYGGNEMSRGNVLSIRLADGKAQMLIMSSLKCKETEQTFHVIETIIFVLSS